ncbi:MAG TPA: plastocyanin/azurin family copper-binding protein [Gemmatimonadaceae bacterium]|nr:plastocyanin/azurin family copper-binding protein [Gemmatimonadaceae bacterium]
MYKSLAVVAVFATAILLRTPTSGEAVKLTSRALHVVRLQSNRFVPAETRVAAGDTIRFINGQGGPHNVEFISDSISASARKIIDSAMPAPKIRELSSGMLILTNEAYSMVMPALPAGRYSFLCSPHAASMRGALIVP